MTTIGYFLSCEEHPPGELVRQATMAQQAGFQGLWISDHYHPWLDEQGQSPFVWSVLGALSQAVTLPVTTAVTCPIRRIHPAVLAQAAATTAVQHQGRFRLGVGTGEALNEHIIDPAWPPAAERREMLEESIEIMRRLFTGELVTHRGKHYRVDTARLYTVPEEPPPIYMSAFGTSTATLAGRIADGFICVQPDAALRKTFEEAGGAGKPTAGGLKVCWGPDEKQARRTAHRLWRTEAIGGEAMQVLQLPRHFGQLGELVTEEQIGELLPCGPDPERVATAVREFLDAGYEEVYVNQIGPDQDGFFRFFSEEVLPRL